MPTCLNPIRASITSYADDSCLVTKPLGPGLARQYRVRAVKVAQWTKYQHVLIGSTARGISLFCGYELQSS